MSGTYILLLPKDGESLPIIGSTIVAIVITKEELIEGLRNNVYIL
jgi:hypothetical protein